MAKSLAELADDLNNFASRLDVAASERAKNIAVVIVQSLAFDTPVDTSTALSNWIVTLESPANYSRLAFYMGEGGSTRAASAAETIATAKQVLANKRPGQVIFITNNVDYLQKLNEGSSSQAPAGFIEAAVIRGRKSKGKLDVRKLRNG